MEGDRRLSIVLCLIAMAVTGIQDPTPAQIIEAKFERARPKLTPIRFTSQTRTSRNRWDSETTVVYIDTIFKSETEYKIERHVIESLPDGTTQHLHTVTWCNGQDKPKVWNSQIKSVEKSGRFRPVYETSPQVPGGTRFHAVLFGDYSWITTKSVIEEAKETSVKSTPRFGEIDFSETFDQNMFMTKETRIRRPMNRAQSDGWISSTTHTRLDLPRNIDKATQFTPPKL